MNEHISTKINIIKILVFFQIFSYIISFSCNDYSFCFECISDKLCEWDLNSCVNSTNNEMTKSFGNPNILPKKCFEENDEKTKNYIAKYCGNVNYNFRDEDKSLSISLPKHSGSLYGNNKLYCEYIISNEDSIESITIYTKKNWGNLKVLIKYIFSETYYEIVLGNGDQNILLDIEELKIIFESDFIKKTSPFEVKILNTFTKKLKILIIVISIASFFILVAILIIIICCRRRRKYANNINNLNNIYINNLNIINDMSTDRMGLLNYLNIIKPIKFNEINVNKKGIKNLKCPIDIENFAPDSDVILTECLHLFHYDCIKNFIEKNKKLKEFRCPLCKKLLYSTSINEIKNSQDDLKESKKNKKK